MSTSASLGHPTPAAVAPGSSLPARPSPVRGNGRAGGVPVLAVGVWMLCMLPLQFTSLLPLSVAVYAATVAACGVALLAQPEDLKQ